MRPGQISESSYSRGRAVARLCAVIACLMDTAMALAANAGAQSPQTLPQLDSERAETSTTIEGNAPAGPQRPLAIVSWHLEDASKAGAVDIRPEPQRVWRHTFGAERKSPSRANFDIARLDADVVLLQGLSMLAHARLLFPASQWRVVASRQIIQPMLPGSNSNARWGSAPRPPTTAIAIRYQRSVRVMGIEHIAEVVAPVANATSNTDAASETPAAVAVRLRINGRLVWAVSADLPQACGEPAEAPTAACPARAALESWQAARRPAERVLIGGPNTTPTSSPSPTNPVCRSQAIAMTDGGASAAPDTATAPAVPASALLPQAAAVPETVGTPSAAPVHARRLVSTARAHLHPLAGCIARLTLD